MKGKELSLLKEIGKVWIVNSKDAKEKIIKDERVIIENNKIMAIAYNMLVFILVFGCIIFDTINAKINTHIMFVTIGIVSYISLILLCKKNAIEGNEYAGAFFIWSFFTLPVSILNSVSVFIYKIENIIISMTVGLVGTIVLIVVLYQIANTIYKKNNK